MLTVFAAELVVFAAVFAAEVAVFATVFAAEVAPFATVLAAFVIPFDILPQNWMGTASVMAKIEVATRTLVRFIFLLKFCFLVILSRFD